MSTILSPKIPLKYACEACDYSTCNKKDYNKHLLTDKHKKLEMSTDFNNKGTSKIETQTNENGEVF